MNKPENVKKPGQVQVTFIRDFDPYDVKEGEQRYVSKGAAKRLFEKWEVIANPFGQQAVRNNGGTQLITVEVVTSLVKLYGYTWFPGSKHDVQLKMVQKHIDDGSVQILRDETVSGVHVDWVDGYGRYEYEPGFEHTFSLSGFAMVLRDVPQEYHQKWLSDRLGGKTEVVERIYNEILSRI